MKKVLLSIAKALCYFLTYVLWQCIVSVVICVIFAASLIFESMLGGGFSYEAFYREYLNLLAQNINLILTVSGALTLITYFVFFLIRKKSFFNEISLKKTGVLKLLPIIPLAVALNVLISSLLELLFPSSQAIPADEFYYMLSSLLTGGSVFMQILCVGVLTPIVEETVFRGLMFTRLRRGMNTAVALIIESAVFGLMHGTLIWMTYGFLLGVILTLVFMKFKTLWAPILLHICFNLMGLIIPNLEFLPVSWLVVIICAAISIAMGIVIYKAKIPDNTPVIVIDSPALPSQNDANGVPEEDVGKDGKEL